METKVNVTNQNLHNQIYSIEYRGNTIPYFYEEKYIYEYWE